MCHSNFSAHGICTEFGADHSKVEFNPETSATTWQSVFEDGALNSNTELKYPLDS